MAIQEITAVPAINESLQESLSNVTTYHPDSNVTPYLDVRAALGVAGEGIQYLSSMAEGTFTADADGAADGVEVNLPFAPKLVVAHNRTSNNLYIKFGTHPGQFSLKGTLATPAWAVTDNTVKTGNIADDDPTGFSINAAEVTDTHIWHYFAIG